MSSDDRVVFGVNLSHDTSCAAVVGGEVQVAIAEERLNRVKHCTGVTPFGKIIPYRSIRYCAEHLGISPREVDLFVVNSCRSNALQQLREQLIAIPEERVIDVPHPGHHLAHALSAFYCSPFEEAAVLVVDTNGSFFERPGSSVQGLILDKKEHYSAYRADAEGVRVVIADDVCRGEVSIGELYCIYSAALQLSPRPGPYGFDDPLSAGGKLMGLASHDLGRTPAPDLWTTEGRHLSIRLDRVIDRLEERGFVAHRRPGLERIFGFEMSELVSLKRRGGRSLAHDEYLSLAGEAQRLLEKFVLDAAARLHQQTGSCNLCVAGGTMLNVTACTRVLEETPFRRMFVQPAANDAGNAIGAALYGYREVLGGRRRPYLERPYDTCLGKRYTTEDIEAAIERHRSPRFTVAKLGSYQAKVQALLPKLLDDRIVALFEGRSEFGPRALGHRSFVASSHSEEMRDAMNRLKQREWYRPVAPAVLEEALGDFFVAPSTEAPFMTFSARAKPLARKRAPAVVHVDGTARPQTVTEARSPLLWHLLRGMNEATGTPILINTSLNVDGEPIAESPDHAVRAFLAGDLLDALMVEDYLLEKVE